MPNTIVFFRDDDVGGLTQPLRDVVDLLLEECVPCNYQVVPAHLSREAADYMRSRKRGRPELVLLNQHGCRHEHEFDGKHSYAEFSGRRPYADQRAALGEGRDILMEMLGDDFGPEVFTPPCHKYDENTLRALQDIGFSILSAGLQGSLPARMYYCAGRSLRRVSWLGKRVSYHCNRIPSTRIVEVSGAIDVDEDVDHRGDKILKSAEDLYQEFLTRRRERSGVLGFMLHHANYVSRQKLDALRELVGRLRSDPTIEFSSIESIAGRVAP